MNRNQLILLLIAIFSFPLVYLFMPVEQSNSLSTLEGIMLSNVNGQKFRLAGQFVKKPLMLVFWSVTCGSCIEEIPFICSLHEKYKDKLTVIGIHPPGLPMKKIKRFLKKFPRRIPYLLAFDDKNALISAYNVTVLPRTLVVGQQGQVLYDHLGYDQHNEQEIENAINKLF